MIKQFIQHITEVGANIVISLFVFIQNIIQKNQKNNQVNTDDLIFLGKAPKEYHPEQMDDVYIDDSFRLRHTYILGATGSGKTNLLESFLRQDIKNSNGFCLIDCHGDLANNVISFLASSAKTEEEADGLARQIIIIEPFNKEWVIGFNPLKVENTGSTSFTTGESKYSRAIEVLSIFQKIWGKEIFGPRTNELFRNTILTLMDNNLTLLEATELLVNDYFRNSLINKITIPEVKNYWLRRYNPLSDKMKAMYREAVINKLTVFTSAPQIRLMLGSNENTFDFNTAINEGKWIILNLAKGYLKENMNLLATLFISQLVNASFQRINIPYQNRKPFYLYIDEFQNFCGFPDLITLLSEGRKYGIGTILAHQHSRQIDPEILKAILGNTQTQIYFRLSYQDSIFFAPELNPKEKDKIARTLIDLEVGKAYLKIKGTNPLLLSTQLCPDVSLSKQKFNKFKKLVFQTHCQIAEAVAEKIEARNRTGHQSHNIGMIAPQLIQQELQEKEDGQDEW